ncbi:MAG: molybdopterin-dependent oxidoreductase [Chthoniobacterales bacterium]
MGGIIYARLGHTRSRAWRRKFALVVFIILPLVAVSAALWPVLGTHYHGLPIGSARLVTLLGLVVSFVFFERTLSLSFSGLTKRPRSILAEVEFSPPIGRRALVLGGLGLLVAGGAAGVLRELYQAATFSYDGTQYKGPEVQAITPNDKFYCVTKNVVDPMVNESLWRLEVSGLVQKPLRLTSEAFREMPAVTQETTLMCISNGLDAGLMSNANWKGVPLRALIEAAGGPLSGARKVRVHGVDNYTDTFPLEKGLEPSTLIAYEMNGERLASRHGFPARAIVPGYFGEKHVKWITRIDQPSANGWICADRCT